MMRRIPMCSTKSDIGDFYPRKAKLSERERKSQRAADMEDDPDDEDREYEGLEEHP